MCCLGCQDAALIRLSDLMTSCQMKNFSSHDSVKRQKIPLIKQKCNTQINLQSKNYNPTVNHITCYHIN